MTASQAPKPPPQSPHRGGRKDGNAKNFSETFIIKKQTK